MEQFSWFQILGTLIGGGFIGGLIPVLNLIKAAVKERRDARTAEMDAHTLQAVETRKLDADRDERNRIEALRISEFYRTEWEKCYEELRARESGNSLSQAKITDFAIALRALRKQIDILDSLIGRCESGDKLNNQMKMVIEKWEDLERILPS